MRPAPLVTDRDDNAARNLASFAGRVQCVV